MSPLWVYLLYISPLFHYSWLFGYTTRTSETLCSRSCTNVWLRGTRWQPDKSEAKWFTCGKRSPLLLGVAHPHTMWVQSVLTERKVQVETRRERGRERPRRVTWEGEEMKKGCRRGKGGREDGEAVTQEMERENGAGRVHWMDWAVWRGV